MQTLLKGIVPLGFLGLCVGIASFMMMTNRNLSTDSTGRNVDGAGHAIDASGISGSGPFPRHCSGKNENHGHSRVSGEDLGLRKLSSGGYFGKENPWCNVDPSDYETALSSAEARLLASQAALELARLTHERNQKSSKKSSFLMRSLT